MARGLLGRSCLKYFNIIIKTTPSHTPTVKKLVKFQKFIFLFVTIFFKRKLSYLIIRSGKFGNLVTSFFLMILMHLTQIKAGKVKFQKYVSGYTGYSHLKCKYFQRL